MEITINKTTTLGSIKSLFNAHWPHLKLVFFTKPHSEHRGTGAKFMIDDDTLTVSQAQPAFKESISITVYGGMTVWEFEQMFEKDLGLHVHVFRRSGNIWLESTVSDDLTLAQQESKGKQSDQQSLYNIDPVDYREQD